MADWIDLARAAPPAPNTDVLLALRDDEGAWIQMGYWDERDRIWRSSPDALMLSIRPTHWMQLPDLPYPAAPATETHFPEVA